MELYDIKPIEPIVDYTFYIFVVFGVIVLLGLIFGVLSYLRMRKPNPQKLALSKLQAIDYVNPKQDAYTITTVAKELVVDEQMEQKYENLVIHLQKYKYQKEVPPFDEVTKKEFELFLELANARI